MESQTEPVSQRFREDTEGRRDRVLCLLGWGVEIAKLSQSDNRGIFCSGLSWGQQARTPETVESSREVVPETQQPWESTDECGHHMSGDT